MDLPAFSDRVSALAGRATPAERRVIDVFMAQRERSLYASAVEIAESAQASDATVIRTARKLGYQGLEELRAALAADLRRDLTIVERMSNELSRAGEGGHSALVAAAGTLRAALNGITALPDAQIDRVTTMLNNAQRVHVFGIGPSAFVAGYFAAQLVRLGFDARAITQTGLQCADDLLGLAAGDAVIALAYDRPYPEVTALFDRVRTLELHSALITSAGPRTPDDGADVIFRVPRGRSGGFGLHAGTMALLEGFLIAAARSDPERARRSLEALNASRQTLSGEGMSL